MPSYLRPSVPGATVFFTVALLDRSSRLLVEEIGRLHEAVRATRAEWPFEVEAWVVLPDHMHCVWRLPEGDADYATRWRLIKGRFAHGLPTVDRRSPSKVRAGEKGIWQRRYWDHHVRDDEDLARCVRYCWLNPVKHGCVERAVDWPFSSVHRDVRAGRIGPAGP